MAISERVDEKQLLDFYRQMLRIDLWEQRLLRLVDEGKVGGFYHSGRGHEAVAVGGCAPLRQDDYLFYDHRGCGQQIAKGIALDKIYADFLGTMHGTTRGLGAGIVHHVDPDLGILGQSGTLGGSFVMGPGAALSAKYRGTDQVCVVFFGDGASNRGTFHEGANAAGLWKLPIVFICENNGWAVSVSTEKSTAVSDLSLRAAGYDMPGLQVDGMDVVAVYEAVSEAVERARRGEGPTFIEAKVYRFRGHFEGDPEKYRTRETVAEWRAKDPILTTESLLRETGTLTDNIAHRMRDDILAEVESAVETALASPMPTRDRLFEGLYVTEESK
jgi:acetoin:2,6-dichlorophenolindophenol oxidoreductase subunit alpha